MEKTPLTGYTFTWLFALCIALSLCLNGCARRQFTQRGATGTPSATHDAVPAPIAATSAVPLTPFHDLTVFLISDALDLLPGSVSSRIFDVIQKGLAIPEQSDAIEASVLSSPKAEDIALITGLIVQRVYGDTIKEGTVIPQAIIYFHKSNITAADLASAAARVKTSENQALDTYNACLNLLVNVLSDNYAIRQEPKEGLYVRDSKNDLYFHTKMKFADK